MSKTAASDMTTESGQGNMLEAERRDRTARLSDVRVRSAPYPYRAMLAICSDLDETPDLKTYYESLKFLNDTAQTSMGPGVGLEVGNSMYFDMPPGQMSYWGEQEPGRELLRELIRSGHVDCLHSFGDLADTRAHAERALEELHKHGCQFEVWVDHAVAPSNFGTDIMKGHGDEPGHVAYHADLTVTHGIRYVWRGQITSVIGQNVAPSLQGVWSAPHHVKSASTVSKQAMKMLLSHSGHARYRMHAPNKVLQPASLRDGTPVLEFLRCNPHYGGVSCCDTADGVASVLNDDMLQLLTDRQGVCILYTHLGKRRASARPFGDATVAAFRRLASYSRNESILTLTTRRLLKYLEVRDCITWTATRSGTLLSIDIDDQPSGRGAWSASDLGGLTLYVPRGVDVQMRVGGRVIAGVDHNPPDHGGRPSITVPFASLEFPNRS